jgi:hypothetical protein
MMHDRRSFSVTNVESAEELARTLTEHTWTLCSGFRLGRYLFLNDPTSEDGAQEYAVFREPAGTSKRYRQVKSITFSWCSYEHALGYIRRVLHRRVRRTGLGNSEPSGTTWRPGERYPAGVQ